jgi:hypothetical protein
MATAEFGPADAEDLLEKILKLVSSSGNFNGCAAHEQ